MTLGFGLPGMDEGYWVVGVGVVRLMDSLAELHLCPLQFVFSSDLPDPSSGLPHRNPISALAVALPMAAVVSAPHVTSQDSGHDAYWLLAQSASSSSHVSTSSCPLGTPSTSPPTTMQLKVARNTVFSSGPRAACPDPPPPSLQLFCSSPPHPPVASRARAGGRYGDAA